MNDRIFLCEFRDVNKRNVLLCFLAYTQIQPNSLVQQHKQQQQQQQQFVALQSQSSQRNPGQLLQTASIQPSQHPVPVLPKPAAHQASTPSQQATIFHSTISPHALHSTLNHTKAQPVQLTAINLQIQPTVSTHWVQTSGRLGLKMYGQYLCHRGSCLCYFVTLDLYICFSGTS